MDKEKTIEKIIKECFWDYDIKKSDILRIIFKGDIKEKTKLAMKIIENMKQPVDGLLLFAKDDLTKIFSNIKVSLNNIEKIKLLGNCLLNQNNKIDKYEWRKFK